VAASELTRSRPSHWGWAVRPEKLASLALLLVLLSAATLGVASALDEVQWSGLWPSVLIGALISWTLGLASVRSRWALPALIVIGGLTGLIFGGSLAPQLLNAARATWSVGARLAADRSMDQSAIAELAIAAAETIKATLVVAERTQSWLIHLIAGQAAFDAVAAAVAWSVVLFSVSAWAGWSCAAWSDGLLAILPATVLTAVTLADAGEGFGPLAVVLMSAILLVATIQHDQRELGWLRNRVAFPAQKGRQLGWWALLAAVALVATAGVLSSQTAQSVWERWTRPRVSRVAEGGGLSRSLGIRSRQSRLATSDDVKTPGLPRERLLTIGPDLATRPLMTVELTEPLTDIPAGLSVPFYWRSYTYDVYTGRGWQTSETISYEAPTNAVLTDVGSPYQWPVWLTLRGAGKALTAVYGDGDIRRIDRPAVVELRGPEDQFGTLIPAAERYQVESIVTIAPERALQRAGQEYPTSIADRFLRVPASVPDRARRLAIELTAGEGTPYDRALSIEAYLRTLPYSLEVDRPPLDQDVVDYFLFQAREGYCDYYASAMVVLSRVAGIPARLAIGYASGEYNEKTSRFLVRESDAHSWAELFFPGVGWIPFEPTAARPPIDRVDVLNEVDVPSEPISQPSRANPDAVHQLTWLVALASIVLIATGGLWLVIDDLRLRRSPLPLVADDIYRQLRRYGVRLGSSLEDSMTPLEVYQVIRDRLVELPGHRAGPDSDGFNAIRQTEIVVNGLVLAYYEPDDQKVNGSMEPIPRTWVRLRWRLRRRWLLWRWNRWVSAVKWRVQSVLPSFGRDHGPQSDEAR
jgi:transglutaminase-like putative cysteine protease